MEIFLYLLACYGICFAIQNKFTFLHGKHEKLDKFLTCPYCVGFHAGWIVYLLVHSELSWEMVFIYAFGSSAFCYVVDISAQYIESKT